MADPDENDFRQFLYCDWSETRFIEFRLDKKLIAVAVSDIVNDGLSVRQVEALVARGAAPRTARSVRREVTRDPNIAAAEESLQAAVGTKVRIHQTRKGGRIEIHFYSNEEMERVYQLILDATKVGAKAT